MTRENIITVKNKELNSLFFILRKDKIFLSYSNSFFDNYFSTNIFFKKYYFIGDNNHIPNHIKYYVKKE
jgi:hypothetical protein